MSDPFCCEVCSKVGPRRIGNCVPEGWHYAEARIDSDLPAEPDNILIVGVCSDACRDRFWKKGPGALGL